MSVFESLGGQLPDDCVVGDGTHATPAVLDKNWQTTAAVGLTVATGGVAGVVMLTALPAQTLAMTGGIAALAYAGDRADKGLPILPWDKAEAKTLDVKAEPAKA